MDLVTCKCAQCDAKLGTIVNQWIQLGKNYITPISSKEHRESLQIMAFGAIRLGEENTVIGGCKLQDAECDSCHVALGLQCLETPSNHFLKRGQFVLRISSVVLKSVMDGRRKIEPKVIQSLKLRGDTSTLNGDTSSPATEQLTQLSTYPGAYNGSPGPDDVDLIQLQADLDAQREEISRIDSAGFQVVSTFQSAITRMEQQVRKLNELVESVRREEQSQRDEVTMLKSEVSDVQSKFQHSPVLEKLERQLQTTDGAVTELREAIDDINCGAYQLRNDLLKTQQELRYCQEENTELKAELEETKMLASEGVEASKEYSSEVSSLRRELKQLRNEMSRDRAKQPSKSASGVSAHELDILTSSISKIGNRASQIESLQMEFELFKTRMQRLEGRPGHGGNAPEGHAEFVSQKEELPPPRYGGTSRQKRASAGRDDDDLFIDTPAKRMAISSDYSSAATGSSGSVLGWGQSSPPTSALAGAGGTGPRLTKSGKIDRRSMRRSSTGVRGRKSVGAANEQGLND